MKLSYLSLVGEVPRVLHRNCIVASVELNSSGRPDLHIQLLLAVADDRVQKGLTACGCHGLGACKVAQRLRLPMTGFKKALCLRLPIIGYPVVSLETVKCAFKQAIPSWSQNMISNYFNTISATQSSQLTTPLSSRAVCLILIDVISGLRRSDSR